jgi:hypothetical protein
VSGSAARFMAPLCAVTSPTPTYVGLQTSYRQAFSFSYAVHKSRSYIFIVFRWSSAYESYFLSIIAFFCRWRTILNHLYCRNLLTTPMSSTHDHRNAITAIYRPKITALKINSPLLLYLALLSSLIIIVLAYTGCVLLYRVFISRLRYTRLNIGTFAVLKVPVVVYGTVTPCSRVDGYQHLGVLHF